MIKKLTCISCPRGCQLEAKIENNCLLRIEGYKCPLGETYARQEIENPVRTLTSTVLSTGLALRWIPVRTSQPIPKSRLRGALQAIRQIRITKPVKAGDIIQSDFLSLGVDLIATRSVE